ncbi:MAG: sigma-70 family RNA polymerase sigma factor [Firmicutes bacterium]|nr:sigma-70 family RNA polymerase sigma factor [Bacillota bacterium]
MIDERKLLCNLKMRKRNSLEEAIKRYTPYVSVIIYNTIGRTASKEDMEEVISDTFLSFWQHIDDINEEKGGIRSYLGAIARNAAKNKLRGFIPSEELNENIASRSAEPQDYLEQNEEKQFLLDMITALGEPDSEIFLRYYYYDEKIKTISSAMGIPTSTVKTKLSRGKTKLKKLIIQNRRDGNEQTALFAQEGAGN